MLSSPHPFHTGWAYTPHQPARIIPFATLIGVCLAVEMLLTICISQA